MFRFNRAQVRNGRIVIARVKRWGHNRGWSRAHRQYIARLCIECCLTESGLLNYGSHKVPGSMALPHDAVGSDHLSVGVFQQQVPMWGRVQDCQNVDRATIKFLHSLEAKGMDGVDGNGPAAHRRIQRVQVSAYADGSNYLANAARAIAFRKRYFFTTRMAKA